MEKSIENKLVTTPFGDSDEIKALANRLEVTSVMPGAQKLTKSESLLLAQIAVAHQLDPFNGEVWIIKGKEGTVKGTMIGIKGLRKKARQQLEKHSRDGSFWIKFRQIDGDERTKYVKDESSIVFESTLTDSETSGQWIVMYSKLKHAGMSEETITAQIGAMPSTIGYGIYNPATEYSKMNPTLVAKKRAEADAIKQRFDVLFGVEYSESLDETNLDYPANEPFEAVEVTAIVDPFDDMESRPFTPEILKAKIHEYSQALPMDTTTPRDLMEFVQKALLSHVEDKTAVYGNVSKFFTMCPAIPAATHREVRAIQRWLEPNQVDEGIEISDMATKELALLVEFLKGK
jgi:hypothetical protein